jgi:hypothetical protein
MFWFLKYFLQKFGEKNSLGKNLIVAMFIWEKRHFILRNLAKIAENLNPNIDAIFRKSRRKKSTKQYKHFHFLNLYNSN